ncbi:MAG: OmpA family protein [Bacteroidales bacterium]|nr:OmpA family protein [Bacteroidales bacterium]
MKTLVKYAFSTALLLASLNATVMAQVDILSTSQDTLQTKKCFELDTLHLNKVHFGPYVSLTAGGGFHTMWYNPEDGKRNSGGGAKIEGNFYWYFTHHWGVGGGLGFTSFNSKATMNYVDHFPNAVDVQNITYDHRTHYLNVKETQNFVMIDIPVGMYYQTEMGQKWRFQAGAGSKLSTQIYGRAKMVENHLETHGYYDIFKLDLYGMDNHNFMDFKDEKTTAYVKTMLSAFTNVNFMYLINPHWDLMLGAYFDCSLNNVRSNQDHLQFDYQTTVYHGVMASTKVHKVHAIDAGIQIGVRRYLGIVRKPQLPLIPEPIYLPDPLETEIIEIEIPQIEIEDNFDYEPEPKKKVDLTKEMTIGYKFGSAEPDYNGDITVIDDMVAYLNSNPSKVLIITGHTDNVGSLASNKAIGLKRAQAFKADLIKHGANASQIRCESKGYLEPIVPNDSEENRAKNRRVTFIAVEK